VAQSPLTGLCENADVSAQLSLNSGKKLRFQIFAEKCGFEERKCRLQIYQDYYERDSVLFANSLIYDKLTFCCSEHCVKSRFSFYADIRERFYYIVLVSIVTLRNLTEFNWNLGK